MNWTVVYLIFSVFCLSAPESVIRKASGQIQIDGVKVIDGGDDGQCPSVEKGERARNEIRQSVDSLVTSSICNGTPGWRRVAFINMTDTSYNCPTGLNLTSYSKRTCGRSHTTDGGCSSTTFSVGGLPYSRVCGRIRGYQFGRTGAFYSSIHQGINGYYVEGVSLTHGASGRRQHIWTFASGRSEVTIGLDTSATCPCDTASPRAAPAFVGNDYFCESGLHSKWSESQHVGVFFPDDVLWDGQNCTSSSTCCQFNNPPWFTKNLPNATTDDIELRICTNNRIMIDDIPIELIELYVQ